MCYVFVCVCVLSAKNGMNVFFSPVRCIIATKCQNEIKQNEHLDVSMDLVGTLKRAKVSVFTRENFCRFSYKRIGNWGKIPQFN